MYQKMVVELLENEDETFNEISGGKEFTYQQTGWDKMIIKIKKTTQNIYFNKNNRNEENDIDEIAATPSGFPFIARFHAKSCQGSKQQQQQKRVIQTEQ